jgi:hypothetical protein
MISQQILSVTVIFVVLVFKVKFVSLFLLKATRGFESINYRGALLEHTQFAEYTSIDCK